MKRLFTLFLSLFLMLGGFALAEIPLVMKMPIYSEYGVSSPCFSSHMEDVPTTAQPVISLQAVDAGKNLVSMSSADGAIDFTPGILAQADWDVDGDGVEEWIVLRHTTEEYEDVQLDLYAQQDSALILLQSEAITSFGLVPWAHQHNFFLYMLDGQACLLSYDSGNLNGPACFCDVFSVDKSGIRLQSRLYAGADGDSDKFMIYTDGTSEANYSYTWTDEDNPFVAEREAASAAFCNRYGLWIASIEDGDAPFEAPLNIDALLERKSASGPYTMMPREIVQTLLLVSYSEETRATSFALPMRGQFLVATGDVNLRVSPGMDGEIAGSLKKETWLRFMGQIHTDDRGVDWYAVLYDGDSLWISSRYSEMR